jgi:hypothetical protein
MIVLARGWDVGPRRAALDPYGASSAGATGAFGAGRGGHGRGCKRAARRRGALWAAPSLTRPRGTGWRVRLVSDDGLAPAAPRYRKGSTETIEPTTT